ncbi:hypothetical protein NDN08_001114 [Rhodosorus marinus]|uniref:Uncharacterized protein n=1 Tax=Rhodosorus marinus TaxID=101924 RepID=A0AAV8UQ05_9RHOD|nr:hypothetical protein NDN08_001114 [Rhodosorus marinus]
MPSTSELIKSAKAALESGDLDRALSLCKDVLKQDKRNYMAFVLVGIAAKRKGDLERSIQAYDRAVSVNEKLPAAWTGLIDTLSEIDDPDVSQLDRLLKALSIVGDKKPGKGLRKAEISTKLAGLDQKRIPDAVRAWTEYADTLSDDDAALRARCEAVRVFGKFTEDEEGSQATLYLHAVQSLLALGKLVPLEIANLICIQLKDLLRRNKVVASNTVDTLGQLHRLAPGSTDNVELILELSEEDDGDVLNLGQYRILASKISHIRRGINSVAASLLSLSVKNTDGADGLGDWSRLRNVTRAQIELQASGRTKNTIASVSEVLLVANSLFEEGRLRLAQKLCVHGLGMLDKIVEAGRAMTRMRAAINVVLGFIAVRDRNFKTAIDLFGESMEHFPVQSARGLVQVDEADGRDPAVSLQKLQGIDPDNPEIVLHTALENLVVEREEAIKLLLHAADEADRRKRSLSERKPRELHFFCKSIAGDWNTVQANCFVFAAQGKLAGGDEAAKDLLVKAASLSPKSAISFTLLGAFFEKQGAQSPSMQLRVRKCYERALAANPAEELAGRRLTEMLLSAGEKAAARDIVTRAAEVDAKSRWALIAAGKLLTEEDAFTASVKYLQLACRSFETSDIKSNRTRYYGVEDLLPDPGEDMRFERTCWLLLAKAYRKTGKLVSSTAAARHALKTKGDSTSEQIQIAMELGLGLTLQGEFRQSLSTFDKAIQVSKESMKVVPVALLTGRAQALYEMAKEDWLEGRWLSAASLWESAEQEFLLAAKNLPSAMLIGRAGDCARKIANLSGLPERADIKAHTARALKQYSRAARLSPWESKNFRDMSLCMGVIGMTDAAERLVKWMLNIWPSRFDLWLALGTVYALAGPRSQGLALHCLSTAVEMQPTAESLQLLGSALAFSGRDSTHCYACAAEAIKTNSSSFHGWMLLGMVREDQAHGDPEKLRSASAAYKMADDLGGGPESVYGQDRMLSSLVKQQRATDLELFAVYGVHGRLGLEQPEYVDSALEELRLRRHAAADRTDVHRFQHLYPNLMDT